MRGAFLFCPRSALLCGSGFRGILSVAGVFFGPLRNFVQRRRACSERVILRRRLLAGAPRLCLLPFGFPAAIGFARGSVCLRPRGNVRRNRACRESFCQPRPGLPARMLFRTFASKGGKRAKSQKRKGKRAILLQKSDKRRKIFLQGGDIMKVQI